MSHTLETEADREREQVVIERITQTTPGVSAHRMPQFSVADYAVTSHGKLSAFIELKIRKQTEQEVRTYGGVIFKYTKLIKLQTLSTLTKAPVVILFAFENGRGPIYGCDVNRVHDYTPQKPAPRRNFRGLPTDEEEVVYLDWAKDLTYRWATRC